MNFFRPSVFGYPARPPLSLPPPYTPLEVGSLAIPGVEIKDYCPSICREMVTSIALDENILDSFILNDKQADLLNVNGTIIMQWYDEVGYKLKA